MARVTESANADPTDVRYAGLGRRLVAFLLDYLIIVAYIVLLGGVNYGIILSGRVLVPISPVLASPVVQDAVAFLTLILPVILYFALQEGSPRGVTWGKRKVGIRVVSATGAELTRKQALVRSLLGFLPWQIAHTSIYHVEGWPLAPERPTPLVMVGFALVHALVGTCLLSALVSKSHRTPYDWVAGSFVIVVR